MLAGVVHKAPGMLGSVVRAQGTGRAWLGLALPMIAKTSDAIAPSIPAMGMGEQHTPWFPYIYLMDKKQSDRNRH